LPIFLLPLRLTEIYVTNRKGINLRDMQVTQREQRRWERYAVKIRTKITINRDGETSSFYGEATDVSRGGLKLFIPRDIETSRVILMELAFPYNSKPMVIRGIIRNRTGFNYGIEFMRVSAFEQDTIAQSCKALQLLK